MEAGGEAGAEYFDREHFRFHEGKARYVRALVEMVRGEGIASGRMLDVGSGFGFLLRAFEEAGFEPYGLEASPYASERSRDVTGAQVVTRSAEEDFPWETGFFEAITMFDVIEHIPDYARMLAECRRTLRRDGLILVATPSAHSIARFLLGSRWSWHKDPTHVHMFSPRMLRDGLSEAGFRDVCTRTVFNFYIVGDATAPLRPLRRISRFVPVPIVGDSVLATARA